MQCCCAVVPGFASSENCAPHPGRPTPGDWKHAWDRADSHRPRSPAWLWKVLKDGVCWSFLSFHSRWSDRLSKFAIVVDAPMNPTSPKAVVLLSGGLDSATTLAIAKSEGFAVYALTFRYGQRHEAEVAASRRVAARFEVAQHLVVDIDLRTFGGSALTADIAVPKGRDLGEMGHGVPITYVPARNTIFLSFALAWAEVLKSQDIFIGVNALDYSGYPDCRPDYIAAYQAMANLATREGVEGRQRLQIHTPLISLTKAQIVRRGLDLGVDYGMTSTCYDPSPTAEACGRCDACLLRLRGFAENGVADPAAYVAGVQR